MFECPNLTCIETFSSAEAVLDHLSNPDTLCVHHTITTTTNALFPSNSDADSSYNDWEWEENDENYHLDSYDEDASELSPDEFIDQPDTPGPAPTPLPQEIPPVASQLGLLRINHWNPPISRPGGLNLLEAMDLDQHAEKRLTNPFYPFASRMDWEVAQFIYDTSLTQQQIDRFLQLDYVNANPLSFRSAKELRSCIEALPDVPRWKHQTFELPGYTTKSPMLLFYRDGVEVAQYLFSNPIFKHCLELQPHRLYEESPDGSRSRVYTEFMSGDFAWEYQNGLGKGSCFLGIILASDKTPLTIGTGGKEMHPVLLSIANIEAGVRNKASSHSFALLAYLPIPKFVDVSAHDQSILAARAYHHAMDIVTAPLKSAEKTGVVMSDSDGNLRHSHTPLASWIADYQEQLLISGVRGKQSPVSKASSKQFGDSTPQPPRTRDDTLGDIATACADTPPYPDPGESLEAFWKVSQALGLSGVHQPVWRDWGTACPSVFLTHDALHGLHKFFHDHPLQWAINILGGQEFDNRLKALQRRVGVRHWNEGISKLKQVTGREHRELEKVFIVTIADAVPDDVLCALRALMDAIFIAQNLVFYEDTIHSYIEALREFHHHKQSIIDVGGRRGKRGVIHHFEIPKLEMLQLIPRSIRLMGAPFQWNTDVTERCHITHVKTPYRMSNGRNFHEQCARFMDRAEKIHLFSLYTTLKSNGISFRNNIPRDDTALLGVMVAEAQEMAIHYPQADWLNRVLPSDSSIQTTRGTTNLFTKLRTHISDDHSTAILLNARPYRTAEIEAISHEFNLPDLRSALGDTGISHRNRQGRRISLSDCYLPFTYIRVWKGFRLQHHSHQDPRIITPSRTVQALPPSTTIPYGRCNTVLINESTDYGFLVDGGSRIIQIRLIFQPVLRVDSAPIFVYGDVFKFSAQYTATLNDGVKVFIPVPGLDMFLLERHRRSNGARVGDIFPLSTISEAVELTACFGAKIDKGMNSDTSLDGDHGLGDKYYLNNYDTKETFHAILSYQ